MPGITAGPSSWSSWRSVVAAFLPVVQNDYQLRRPGYVYENPHVRSGLTPSTIAWSFTTFQESNWHPLTWISHALYVTLFGVSAPAHHGMSLLLHLLSAILLFVLMEKMTGDRWPSAFVALVFAIHPLHVESVVWISERKDVLSGLFLMLTLGSYAAYARGGGRTAYLRTLALFALGLMAKPMLVTLPFVLLLLDYWPLGRMPGSSGAGRGAAESVIAVRTSVENTVPPARRRSSVVTYRPERGARSPKRAVVFADRGKRRYRTRPTWGRRLSPSTLPFSIHTGSGRSPGWKSVHRSSCWRPSPLRCGGSGGHIRSCSRDGPSFSGCSSRSSDSYRWGSSRWRTGTCTSR